MKKSENASAQAAELRRCAEERLRSQAAGENLPRTEADMRRLLHELQVHQIELEMQNAEPRQARNEVETAPLALFDTVLTGRGKMACEVTLTTEGNSRLFTHIEAVAFETGQECRVSVIDITPRKRAEDSLRERLRKSGS
jgi:hypothetical protein